jgi:hypothetical protein
MADINPFTKANTRTSNANTSTSTRQVPNQSESPFSSSSHFTSRYPPYPTKIGPSKVFHLVDISYPESYLRTQLPNEPFLSRKWHDRTPEQEKDNGILPIFEGNDPDDTEDVVQSVETDEESRLQGWPSGERHGNGWERGNLKRGIGGDDSGLETRREKKRRST